MRKKSAIWILLVAMTVIGLSLTGCMTDVSNWYPYWNAEPVRLQRSSYIILGEVVLEKQWINVLGIYQSGGITYASFLAEARRLYKETDAIIDIHLDCEVSKNPFFQKRKYTALGYAVKYPQSVP